jgi:hypothetical protein
MEFLIPDFGHTSFPACDRQLVDLEDFISP